MTDWFVPVDDSSAARTVKNDRVVSWRILVSSKIMVVDEKGKGIYHRGAIQKDAWPTKHHCIFKFCVIKYGRRYSHLVWILSTRTKRTFQTKTIEKDRRNDWNWRPCIGFERRLRATSFSFAHSDVWNSERMREERFLRFFLPITCWFFIAVQRVSLLRCTSVWSISPIWWRCKFESSSDQYLEIISDN